MALGMAMLLCRMVRHFGLDLKYLNNYSVLLFMTKYLQT